MPLPQAQTGCNIINDYQLLVPVHVRTAKLQKKHVLLNNTLDNFKGTAVKWFLPGFQIGDLRKHWRGRTHWRGRILRRQTAQNDPKLHQLKQHSRLPQKPLLQQMFRLGSKHVFPKAHRTCPNMCKEATEQFGGLTCLMQPKPEQPTN